MHRLTRMSYKRKLVVYGVTLFSGVSLLTTGMSAWVVSQGSQHKDEGNVNIGTVKEKSVDIIDLMFLADSSRTKSEDGLYLNDPVPYSAEDIKSGKQSISYIFDSMFGDNYGRVKFNPELDSPFESLRIEFYGTITNAKQLDKLGVSLKLPQSVKMAVDKGYIIAPEGTFYEGEEMVYKEIKPTKHETDSNKVNFKSSLEFKWGTAFLGVNPSQYFDEELPGVLESDDHTIPSDCEFEELIAVLNELRGLILGVEPLDVVTYEDRTYNTYDEKALEEAKANKFEITITATAK